MRKSAIRTINLLGFLLVAPLTAQNLLDNATFDDDLSGWGLDNGIDVPIWSPEDAEGSAASGSAELSNTHSAPQNEGGPYQCVPVTGGQSYLLSGKGFMPSGQAGSVQGWLVANWYSSTDCSTGPLSSSFGNHTTVEDTWQLVSNTFDAPASAASARINLGVYKLTGTEGVPVVDRWDDIFFGPATSSCTPDSTHLCLLGTRFRVSVDWTNYNTGVTAAAHATPFVDESGFFYFEDPANIEIMVKIHDACPGYGHFWFFSAATTNVGYTITVVDTKTGQTETYSNPARVLSAANTDQSSFGNCPP